MVRSRLRHLVRAFFPQPRRRPVVRQRVRPCRPFVEGLEDRLAPATTPTFVNDNWNLVTDNGAIGVVDQGDILNNANDTINPGTVTVTYGVNGFGTVTTGTATGSDPNFDTINDAITNTTAGGTVNILGGNYAENVVLNKLLTLSGARAGIDARGRVVGSPNPASESVIAPASGRALELQAGATGGSVIDGFAFVGSLSGATGVIESTTGVTDLLVLKNNYVAVATGFTASALFLNKGALDADIDRNEFIDAAGSSQAVFFDGPDLFHGLHFTNNNVLHAGTPGGTGLFVDGDHNWSISASLRTPLMQGNLFQGHSTGVNLGSRSFGSLATSNAGTISQNTFNGNAFDGLQGGMQHVLIKQNTFSNNGRDGLALTSFGNTAADRGAQNNLITENFFSGNGGNPTLMVPGEDVFFSSGQAAGTISTNTLSGNSLTSPKGVTYNGSEVIDVENNWWGSATGPTTSNNPGGTGATLTNSAGTVDFVPFLTSGTDRDATTPGFQACPPLTANATLGSGSPSYPSTTGQQTGRLNRNGIASTCENPKANPGLTTTTGARQYDEYTYTNFSQSDVCVAVTYTTSTATGSGIFAVAYQGAGFNPANPSANYLADPGFSVTASDPGPRTFSFTVLAGASFDLVFHAVDPGANVGSNYSFTVAGLPCFLDINGTGGTDTLVINATGPNSGTYSLNGGPAIPFVNLVTMSFDGGGGDDTLTINNPTGSMFAPSSGIFYDGGGQPGDSLVLSGGGGAAFSETYSVGTSVFGTGNDKGTIVTTNGTVTQTIQFAGLAPIDDTVNVGTYTINATDGANAISIVNGTGPRVRVTVDAFEAADFQNKTNVVVNGGDGTAGGDAGDTITVNFTNTAGMSALTVNGDEGDDSLSVTATAVATTLNGNDNNDTFILGNGVSLPGGAVNGGNGTDTLDYSAWTTGVSVNLGSNAPLSGTLDGDQVVTPTTSTATGTVSVTYNNTAHTYDITVNVTGISATDANLKIQLNRAPVGSNGAVLTTLFDAASAINLGTLTPAGSGFTFTATGVPLAALQEAALLGGLTYVNVASTAFTTGEIRGQAFPNAPFATATPTATGVGTLSNVENATGGLADDSLVGDLNVNVLNGGPGSDVLVGSRGNDTLQGGPATATLLALDAAGTSLLRFAANAPGTTVTTAISGLVGGETLVGIDFRPATGQLYGLSSQSRLYVIQPFTGAATQVGSSGAFTISGTSFGFDFNPTVDRIRVTSDADQNLRLNPNDGTLTTADTPLAYAAGDPNAAANPNVVGSAYTNSFNGATATTLFAIDSNLDILAIQNPPNNGTLNTVGALGVNTSAVVGFDIVPGSNLALATLVVGGTTGLYSINLSTGAATLLGTVGSGTAVNGLAVVPDNDILVWSNGDGNDVMDGGTGNDLVNVNGNVTGDDVFTVAASATPGRVDFQRVPPSAPFSLDIGTVENLTVNGIGGNDSFTVNSLAGVADLRAVNLNGFDGTDTFNIQLGGSVTINVKAGLGDDNVAFANAATLNGGAVAGGPGTDTLDYSAYTSVVAVNLGINTSSLVAGLDGDQETPPNGSTATGTATLTYNNTARTFDITLAVSGITPAQVSGFHLQRGPVAIDGPIIVNLLSFGTPVTDGSGGFTFTATGVPLAALHEAALLGGLMYLNVHTTAFPNGAIRGQVFPGAAFTAATPTATGVGTLGGVENAIGGSGGSVSGSFIFGDSFVGSTGANVLRGGVSNDVLVGGPGGDTLQGEGDDDFLVWSNGDGSDVMDGGPGTADVVNVNGNVTADDVFTVGAAGTRVAFARTSPGPFTLDIGTAETLLVNGPGGNDTVTVGNLAGVADLTAIKFFGLAGNDTFIAQSANTVTISVMGGPGSDTLIGPDAGATWNITGNSGTNQGNLPGVVADFANVENLTGGSGADNFVFGNATSMSGTIDGGAGTDTLDYSAYTSVVSVNLGINTSSLIAGLDGGQETPPNASTATGTATLTYDNVAHTFGITMTVTGIALAQVTAFKLHRSQAGVAGPAIVALDAAGVGTFTAIAGGFTYSASGVALSALHEAALLGGLTYLEVRTTAFPVGEIRGQVFPGANFAAATPTATGTGGVANVENATGGSGGSVNGAFIFGDSFVGSTGANVLRGGVSNDVLVGGPGGDTLQGEGDDDFLVWSNGDGSDVMDGGPGTADVVNVNGNVTADDVFTVGAAGTRVAFARTSPGPFTLDIGTAETLIVNGMGGDDLLRVNNPAGDLLALPGGFFFNGGAGATAAGDRLEILGGAHTTETHTFATTSANGHDGAIVLVQGATTANYTYTGLQPVLVNAGTPTSVLFNLAGVADNAFLEDDGTTGNSLSQLRSANNTFETTTFVQPTGSLTINAGAGDVVTLNLVDSLANAGLTVTTPDQINVGNVVAGTGTVTLSATGVITEFSPDAAADVTAGSLVATAGTGIDLDTQVGSVSAGLTGNGAVTLTEAANATVTSLNAGTGTITLDGGTFTLGASNVLADASTLNVAGATLNIGAFSDTVALVRLTSGTIAGTTGVLTSTATIDARGGTAGAVLGGTAGLTKTTAGTVTLAGANTYTGPTTVNGGILAVTGSIAAGSAVTVNSTGTLGGTGTVNGSVTVNSGGTLAPGISPGILRTGNLTLNSGSTFAVEANNPYTTAGTDYDQASVTGTVTLNGAILSLSGGAVAPTTNKVLTIINNDGTADPVTGTFAGRAEGATVMVGTVPMRLSYVGGDGNDVTLSVMPPTITSANATVFTSGVFGSFTVTTMGVPTPALTQTGALPSGVSFVDNGNGTATLSGTPAPSSVGVYPLSIKASNGVGSGFTQAFTLTVQAPPGIAGLQVGPVVAGFANQRSRIDRIVVTFAESLSIHPDSAFSLVRVGGPAVPLTVTYNADFSRATLTFSGPNVAGGSLIDGRYRLTVDGSQLITAGGVAIDADGDRAPGGTLTFDFHRLFGDSDGDADTDFTDLARFRLALGGPSTTPLIVYNPVFDSDGDGDVDFTDLAQFRLRLGTVLP